MRASSQNLFTFAKSNILVDIEDEDDEDEIVYTIEGNQSIGEFDIYRKILPYFKNKVLEVQVMFDYLNEALLQNVAQFGTRVLYLTSNCFDPDYLLLEDHKGV